MKKLLALLFLLFACTKADALVPMCTITGVVNNSVGVPCANCTVFFDQVTNQVVGGNHIARGFTSTTTDASGNLTGSVTTTGLPQGTVQQVTVSGGAAMTTVVPFASTVTWANFITNTNAASGGSSGTFTNFSANGNISITGTGTTGGDVINHVNVNGLINLLTFGGTCNGVADDGPALRSAVAAAASGATIQFPPSAVCYFNSDDPGNTNGVVNISNKSLVFDLNGSTLKVGPAVTHAIFSVFGGVQYKTLGTLKGISAAHRGDISITTTVHSDAGTFTPGDTLYIQGEVTDNFDTAENFITSANSSTGVVGLYWPLGKNYTTTPKAADVETSTLRGFTVQNGKVIWASSAIAQLANVANVVGPLFQNLIIDGTNLSGTASVQANANVGLTWRNNTITTTNFGTEVGARGSIGSYVINNTVNNISSSSSGALGSCEGCERMQIESNNFNAVGGASSGAQVDFSTGADNTIADNVFTYGALTGNAASIVLNNGSGAATDTTIVGNNMHVYWGIDDGGLNTIVSGNTIEAAIGIKEEPVNPATLTGNTFLIDQAGFSSIDVNGNNGADNSIISGNIVTNATGTTCTCGLTFEDPGSVQTWTPLVTANHLTECGTSICYAGSAATNLPKRIILSNPGVANLPGQAFIWAGGTANTTVSNSATNFWPVNFHAAPISSGENAIYAYLPTAANFSNLSCVSGAAPGGVASYAISLRNNSSASALTCTMTGAATTCSDTTHVVSEAAGTFMDMMSVPSGTPTAIIFLCSVTVGD